MTADDDERQRLFVVVQNAEEQYSIWPHDSQIPGGWTVIGQARGKFECLKYIDSVWTDLRPRSVRQEMSAHRAGGLSGASIEPADRPQRYAAAWIP